MSQLFSRILISIPTCIKHFILIQDEIFFPFGVNFSKIKIGTFLYQLSMEISKLIVYQEWSMLSKNFTISDSGFFSQFTNCCLYIGFLSFFVPFGESSIFLFLIDSKKLILSIFVHNKWNNTIRYIFFHALFFVR